MKKYDVYKFKGELYIKVSRRFNNKYDKENEKYIIYKFKREPINRTPLR